MGDGVSDLEVVRKGASGNLVIVIRVTPSTESVRRGIVEDGRIAEVGAGIYEVRTEHQHNRRPAVSQASQPTQRPIPVRPSSPIITFGPQRGLEVVDVGTVPRQEETGIMDLSDERGRMSPQICVTFARSDS